jgi:hypothetical protein
MLENYLLLPAGPKLDVIVAEFVMGWWDFKNQGGIMLPGAQHVYGRRPDRAAIVGEREMVRFYSTEMEDAWDVRGRMHVLGYVSRIEGFSNGPENRREHVSFTKDHTWKNGMVHFAEAETAALAICRAALLAVRWERGRR